MGAHTSALLVRFGSLPALVHSLITGSRSRMAGMFAVLLLSAAPHVARAVDAVTALQLESGATPTCIGFKWFVAGDDDLDASVSVSFRPTGTSDWQVAQPLLRVEPGIYNEYGVDPGNLLAGSIFGLEPGRAYDVRLVLSDPDGGFATRTVIVTTRPEPADPVLPRLRYVVPGAGGGTGTQTDPFRGIAAANAQALPGDVFLLQPGTYFGVSALTRSGLPGKPIVWKGTDASAVVLDGQDTAKPVVDFSGSQYVHLENVTVRRPRQMAIRGYATTGLVIRDCIVDSSNLTGSEKGGIYLLGPGHTDATITDNVIRGPFHWEDGRNDDAYALIVVGTGHVVAHNEIYDWWDGLTVGHGETDVETSNCDVYGNEVYDCTDDGIETDGSRHNIRIWDNRFTNVLCGISAQPVFGGPVYSIRNVVYDFQLKPLKFQVWPTGLIVFDNTFVGADPRGWGEGQWRNAIVRNNLFIGGSEPGHNGDPIALDTSGIGADFDFNGWYQAIPNRFGRFNGVLYRNLADFQQAMGMSWSAVLLDIGVFVDAEEPPLGPYLGNGGYPPPYEPGSQDLRLRSGSPAEDAGVLLANINDGYLGAAPDLGAYEIGRPIPHYGPGSGAPTSVPEVGVAVAALSITPNPSRALSHIELRGAADGAGVVRIFTGSGRLVRTLTGTGGPGFNAWSWDGRDEAGREVPAGAYYVRLSEPGASDHVLAQARAIRLR